MARETINEREGKNNCSKHSKEVAGISDMKVLAEMIGDLHYETLADLLNHLANKIYDDGINDFNAGRTNLSSKLYQACDSIGSARHFITQAWQISEPFMNNNQNK